MLAEAAGPDQRAAKKMRPGHCTKNSIPEVLRWPFWWPIHHLPKATLPCWKILDRRQLFFRKPLPKQTRQWDALIWQMYSSFISIVALILKQLVHCRLALLDRQNVRKSSKNNIDQVCLLMTSLRTPSNIIYTDKYKRNIVLDFRGSSSLYCDDIISYQLCLVWSKMTTLIRQLQCC